MERDMEHYVHNWRKNRLFEGLSDEQMKVIGSSVKEKTFGKNEFILREGNPGKELYLLEEGHVEVLKLDELEGKEYRISHLQAGSVFGEMVFFGKKVRSASIRTFTETKVLEISIGDLEKGHPEIVEKILNNFSHHFAARLEENNEYAVLASKKLIAKEKQLNAMSRLSLQVFVVLILYQCLVSSLVYFTNLLQDNAFFFLEMPIIIAIAVYSYYLIKKSGAPPSAYGLTLQNGKKSLLESLLATVIVMVVLIGIKWVAIHLIPAYEKAPLFELSIRRMGATPSASLFAHWKPTLTWTQILSQVSLFLYLLSTPLQEFIVRGVLQTSLQRTISGRNRITMAIVISNLIFAGMHEPLFWLFPIAVFLPGLMWGWLFARHRTLIGVSLSHLILGFWAFYIIGFPYN